LNRIRKDAAAMVLVAIVFLVISIVGFTPMYFTPLITGGYTPPSPWMHPHAVSSLIWLLVFLIQPLLILSSQRTSHRWLGRFGVAVAAATLITGIGLQIDLLPLGAGDQANLGAATARLIGAMAVFLPAVGFAVAYRRTSAWHLRLMFLATLALMAAPVVRVMIYYLNIAPEVAGPLSSVVLLAIAAALPLYDRWVHGRVERISWIILATVFLTQLAVGGLLSTSWWVGLLTGH
jgi:hypothetical protein